MRQNTKRRSNPKSQRAVSHSAPSRNEQSREFLEFYANCDLSIDYTIAMLRDGSNRFFLTRTADSLLDVATVRRRYSSEGLGFLTKCLPGLFQNLLNYLETGISSYPGFKLAKGQEYPAFLRQYFAKIYDENTCELDKAMYIDHIYQVCVAFKKLKGPYRSSVLRKQLADFVETDMELRYIDFRSDTKLRVISDSAATFITRVLKKLDVDEQVRKFVPRPGPGATNTNVEKHLRFRPHVLYTQLDEQFPYEDWFYSHPWDLVTETYKHPFKLPVEEMPTSRFKFVPKTFSKPRGICIEQLETQYLQQAVKKGLYETIETSPLTRGKINFSSQSINGDLALVNSFTRNLATIDMKEASDRISRKLVRYLFKGLPDFRDKIMALSTRIIELPDEINFIEDYPAAKFAPMGSALCFPVMALVHYALIRAICQYHKLHEHIDSIYVYGDDILCHRDVVQHVYEDLPKFGMKLNTEKSYYKSFFRESCGVHAYYGREITPVYFKYIPITDMDASSFISCLQVEGQLYKKGYYETAELLRRALRKVNAFGLKLPYVKPMSPIPGFVRDDATLLSRKDFSHSRRRWDPDTQTYEYRVVTLVPVQESLPCIQQDEGLLRWHLTSANLERYQDKKTGVWCQGNVRGSLLRFKTKVKWLRESALNAAWDTPLNVRL